MISPMKAWIHHLNNNNAAQALPPNVRYRNGALLWSFSVALVAIGFIEGVRQSASGAWLAECVWTGVFFSLFFGRLTLFPVNPGRFIAWLVIFFVVSSFLVMEIGSGWG